MDGKSYHRTPSHRQGTIVADGEPLLSDPQVADLFAFLLESNDARRAIKHGGDLHDLIMRPVNTDEIDSEIARLEERRRELTAELDELEALASKLPGVEEERTALAAELEETLEALEAKRAELETLEADRGTPQELAEPLEELQDARGELKSVRRTISEQERVVEALEEDRNELQRRLEGLSPVAEEELPELEAAIGDHRDAVESIESSFNVIQTVIQFNESFLDRSRRKLNTALQPDADRGSNGSVTDQLVDD